MHNINIEKRVLKLPQNKPTVQGWRLSMHVLISLLLLIPAILLSYLWRTPGLNVRWLCMRLGITHLMSRSDWRTALRILIFPLDSVRYFEFDFMLKHKQITRVDKCLDVSSPRLLAACWNYLWPQAEITLLNPDKKDVSETERFVEALGFSKKCQFKKELLENAELDSESYDLVSCMSVLEHIPDDREAVAKLWRVVKPGGVLVLTVPCHATYYEEHTNLDVYELFSHDDEGYVFWQRFYDERRLSENVFSITGQPAFHRIYGENRAGFYDNNVLRKRTHSSYPYWYEPLMMGRNFSYRNSFNALTGMGVIGMVFIKPLPV